MTQPATCSAVASASPVGRTFLRCVDPRVRQPNRSSACGPGHSHPDPAAENPQCDKGKLTIAGADGVARVAACPAASAEPSGGGGRPTSAGLAAAGRSSGTTRKCMDPPHRRAGGQAPGGNRSAISLVAGGVAPARSHLEANGGACLLMLTQVYTDGAPDRHFRQIGPDFNNGCRPPPSHAC